MARALQTLQILTAICVAAAVGAGYAAHAGSLDLGLHIRWGLFVALLVAFTHSMTLFYLIGSSGNVREAIRPHGWSEYLKEMAVFHKVLSPWLMLAIGAGLFAVVTGGGAHTHVWPAWLHQATALLTLALNAMAAWKGVRIISRNVTLQRRLDLALRSAERAKGGSS